MSVRDTVENIKKGELSCEDLVKNALEQIRLTEPSRAYLSVFAQEALEKAKTMDRKRSQGGALGGLAGIPLAVKDNIAVQGGKTTCGSRMLENFESPYDATAVLRLKQADGIVIGKTNLDEFAMGSSTENSAFGRVVNPLDPGLIPGGSSGGSAAAVALDTVPLSLGSDTGGSVRQPAACCGVIGVKPTYGRISRYGLVAFASSLDQIGILGKSVEDTAYVLNILAGADEKDQTSVDVPLTDFTSGIGEGVKGKVLGVPVEYFKEGLDSRVKICLENTLAGLEKEGAVLREISLPHVNYGVAVYYIIAAAEASSNLARYDGVRYSRRSKHAADIKELFAKSRAEGFGKEVKKRILLGSYVLCEGFHDDYYMRAQRIRRKIMEEFKSAFQTCHAVVTPTVPGLPPVVGEYVRKPMDAYLGDVYTVGVNLAGLPGIAVPSGKIGKVYASLQIIGRPFKEGEMFQIASAVEQLSK
ncbi:Asp-tRNA(Asn)/Glu-tRNA(Gln) amidotransferase subunit GatA [Fibrobacterota bacterium]